MEIYIIKENQVPKIHLDSFDWKVFVGYFLKIIPFCVKYYPSFLSIENIKLQLDLGSYRWGNYMKNT